MFSRARGLCAAQTKVEVRRETAITRGKFIGWKELEKHGEKARPNSHQTARGSDREDALRTELSHKYYS